MVTNCFFTFLFYYYIFPPLTSREQSQEAVRLVKPNTALVKKEISVRTLITNAVRLWAQLPSFRSEHFYKKSLLNLRPKYLIECCRLEVKNSLFWKEAAALKLPLVLPIKKNSPLNYPKITLELCV